MLELAATLLEHTELSFMRYYGGIIHSFDRSTKEIVFHYHPQIVGL